MKRWSIIQSNIIVLGIYPIQLYMYVWRIVLSIISSLSIDLEVRLGNLLVKEMNI